MRTVIVIVIGIALAAVLYAVARARRASFAELRPWFTGFWALATAVNLYVSVAFLRRSSAEELPLFFLAAAVPIAVAYALPWLFGRART